MQNKEQLKALLPKMVKAYKTKNYQTFRTSLPTFKECMEKEFGFKLNDKECVFLISRASDKITKKQDDDLEQLIQLSNDLFNNKQSKKQKELDNDLSMVQ